MCDMLTDERHGLEHAVEHLNRGEVDEYLSIHAAAAVVHGLPVEFAPNVDGLRAFHAALDEGFADVSWTIEDVIGEEHRLAVRITFEGTHEGPFLGFTPSGRRVSVGGITILHYDGGRVAERWRAFDDLGLVRQIGAMEPVGARA